MSEINNIKSLGQSELVTSQNAAARDNQKSASTDGASSIATPTDTVSSVSYTHLTLPTKA